MNIALFEDCGFERLLPLTWLRATFELILGKDRLIDKVRTSLGPHVARLYVRPELRPVVSARNPLDPAQRNGDWLILNGRACIMPLAKLPAVGVAWRRDGRLIAATISAAGVESLSPELFLDRARLDEWASAMKAEEPPDGLELIRWPWELPVGNAAELTRQCVGHQDESRSLAFRGVHFVHPEQICVGPRAQLKPGAVLDAESGPIHIDAGALVEPNAVIQGPAYIGPKAIVRPGAVIRHGTTVGPVCKVGGEIEASIFHGYANKQHDGFLGHSYVSPWVNLGADTVTSDLKNTYGTIRVFINGVGVETGQHFIGSIIADHAKTGIGTILPTGCVVGVSANVFMHHAIPKFVPSFAWLTDAGMETCRVEKALQIASVVMGRREIELTPAERELFEQVAYRARQVEAAGWNLGEI